MAKVIVVDEQRCLACKQCMLECAMAHSSADTLVEAVTCELPPQSRVHVESVGDAAMPMQCRHCEDAPCMAVCPSGAIYRRDRSGVVLVDQEQCIGCKFCLMACPFGVLALARSGKAVVKCDQCIDRTEAGEDPACVSGCPTGALQFVELDEHLQVRRREAARVLVGRGAGEENPAG